MDHRHKVFMASGDQDDVLWPGFAIFPGELRGSPGGGGSGRSASEGGGDHKLLLQPHRACQGEEKNSSD